MADPTRTSPNRRGRNVPKLESGWTVLPAKGRVGRPPGCLVTLSEDGRKLWARWWASPMATQWNETDVPGLSRLAELYEAVFDGTGLNQSQTAQIDRLEKAFGLTPDGRKNLKWVIVEDEPESDGVPTKKGRYSHLSVVDEASA